VGDDGLGVRVLEELLELGIDVVAVCARDEGQFAQAAQSMPVALVVGDLKSEGTLREANVEGARACALLTGGDLGNLHVALQLEELASQARVVMRVFNTSLAGPVRQLLGDVVVMSASELAAPAFVEAALRGSADFELRVADRQVTVQEVDLSDPRLRLALADVEAARGEVELFPERASRVVGIVDQGPVDGHPEFGSGAALDLRIARRQASLVTTLARLYRASWLVARGLVGVVDRRLAVVAVLFTAMLVGSSLLFDSRLGISLLDAFYFTVSTVMSVGYGDINLLDAPPGVKLFGTAIMVLGGLVLALAFALLTDAIVGARLAQALGQGPLPKRHHVVVCGLGRTGGRILENLVEAGVTCVAVEREESTANRALLHRLGVPLVLGDAAAGETLDGLRLGSARALMAMTDDDLANLQCALLARARAPELRVVLRLFDQDLAERVQRATDIDLSRSVAALAAPAFTAAILGRRATAVLPVGSEIVQIAALTARRSTVIRTIEEDCQARVVAVHGAAFPDVRTRVAAGDELTAVGTSRGLADLERRLTTV
jgi:Trk K+ transport system NAD-binding subunit